MWKKQWFTAIVAAMSRKGRIAITAVTALIVSSVATGVLGAAARSDHHVDVCGHRSNGNLRMLSEEDTGCTSSEQTMEWVVGGEVSSVSAGAGLVGGGEDGDVTLAVDPALLQTDDRIVAGFAGPGDLPPTIDPSPIASLAVPAGDFAIFAKVGLTNPGSDDDDDSSLKVRCRLEAGGDTDESGAELMPGNVPPVSNNVDRTTIPLEIVHRFDRSGVVVLACGGDRPGGVFHSVKIIAHEGNLLSNGPLGS